MRRRRRHDLLAALAVGDEPRADGAVDVADEVVDAVVADREAEVLRRHVFELVRLVDDGVAAARDDLAEGALPDRGVGAEQVVVDDDDVGLGGALAHA